MPIIIKEQLSLLQILHGKELFLLLNILRKKIDVPVVITNDANAAAMGEMIFGGAKKMKDFIVLTLGTGLGSGIVINGEVGLRTYRICRGAGSYNNCSGRKGLRMRSSGMLMKLMLQHQDLYGQFLIC